MEDVDRGTDAMVEEDEDGRRRHRVDYGAVVGDRSAGLKEGQTGLTGAKDGDNGGRGQQGAHVVGRAPTLQVCTQGSAGPVDGQVGQRSAAGEVETVARARGEKEQERFSFGTRNSRDAGTAGTEMS